MLPNKRQFDNKQIKLNMFRNGELNTTFNTNP